MKHQAQGATGIKPLSPCRAQVTKPEAAEASPLGAPEVCSGAVHGDAARAWRDAASWSRYKSW